MKQATGAARRARRASKPTRFPEYVEQCALFEWAAKHENRYPVLRNLFAVPNSGGFSGGFKANMIRVQRLRKAGLKAGVPDVWFPVARHGYHGLVIELKAPGELCHLAGDQREWITRLEAEGYNCLVYDRWQHAANSIAQYIGIPELVIQFIPPSPKEIERVARARARAANV